MEGNKVTRFVGLRSKLYSLTIQKKVEQENVVNGVKKITIKYEENKRKWQKGLKNVSLKKIKV